MNHKILIVDDEPLIAVEIEATLAQAGYHSAGLAASVDAAMAHLNKNNDISAVIVDANLNNQTAESLLDHLKSASIPFLLVSGYSREQIGDWAEGLPLISKPIVYRDLVTAVGDILA